MKRLISCMVWVFALGLSGYLLGAPSGPVVFDTIVFEEHFDQPDGSLPDAGRWVIGHPDDSSGWFVLGRTFFPTPSQHPSAPFPHVEGGACVIEHYHYNPFHLTPPKTTFLGGEIHTVMGFDPTKYYCFEARVRWPEAPRGLVTSFFTYGYDVPHKDSDEIDFEFLSNEVFEPSPQVLTNTWNDSQQKAEQKPIPELDITQWQKFRIYWYPDPLAPKVEWTWFDPAGDEKLLRSETDIARIPDEPMSLYFNLWAPTSIWPKAYDGTLEPHQVDNGVMYEYWVDDVVVLVPEPTSCMILAIGAVWLLTGRSRWVRRPPEPGDG